MVAKRATDRIRSKGDICSLPEVVQVSLCRSSIVQGTHGAKWSQSSDHQQKLIVKDCLLALSLVQSGLVISPAACWGNDMYISRRSESALVETLSSRSLSMSGSGSRGSTMAVRELARGIRRLAPAASRLLNENLGAIESKPYLLQLSRAVRSRRRCACLSHYKPLTLIGSWAPCYRSSPLPAAGPCPMGASRNYQSRAGGRRGYTKCCNPRCGVVLALAAVRSAAEEALSSAGRFPLSVLVSFYLDLSISCNGGCRKTPELGCGVPCTTRSSTP